MPAGMKFDALGNVLARFARGRETARTNSLWWNPTAGEDILIQEDSLDPNDPALDRLTPEIYKVTPYDPETFEECTGMSIIKARGFPGRIGQAGGRKRTSWTPCQPRQALDALTALIPSGSTVEGVFWLEDNRFCIDGALPSDATLFGRDAHDVRYVAILDYTGSGADKLLVSLTRAVCTNTVGAAEYSAKRGNNVLKIRHAANIVERWAEAAPAFLADYSRKIGEYAAKILRLNDAKLIHDATATVVERIKAADALFVQMLGGEVDPDAGKRVHTARIRELNALRVAYATERVNALSTGFDPDSVRPVYEAFTNVANHGGEFTEKRAGKDVSEWRPFLNGARTDAKRTMALVDGSVTGPALASAMAWIAPPPPVILS